MGKTDCTIRAARAEDVEAIVVMWRQIADQHAQHDCEHYRLAEDANEKWRVRAKQLMERQDATVLVAADRSGSAIGFVTALISPLPPVLAERRHGSMTNLFVEPAHRGKGVGRMLAQAALDRLRSLGVEEVTLTVATGNEEAVRLYQTMGMKVFAHKMCGRL